MFFLRKNEKKDHLVIKMWKNSQRVTGETFFLTNVSFLWKIGFFEKKTWPFWFLKTQSDRFCVPIFLKKCSVLLHKKNSPVSEKNSPVSRFWSMIPASFFSDFVGVWTVPGASRRNLEILTPFWMNTTSGSSSSLSPLLMGDDLVK